MYGVSVVYGQVSCMREISCSNRILEGFRVCLGKLGYLQKIIAMNIINVYSSKLRQLQASEASMQLSIVTLFCPSIVIGLLTRAYSLYEIFLDLLKYSLIHLNILIFI